MNEKEIVARRKKGGIWMLGEYRGGKAETVTYRDKVTGKAAQFSSIVHTIENGDTGAIALQERVSDGADISKFQVPFKKGQALIVQVDTIEKVQGFLRATGNMFLVEG